MPEAPKFNQTFREELTPVLLKRSPEIAEVGTLPNSSSEAYITLITKPGKDIAEKENYSPAFETFLCDSVQDAFCSHEGNYSPDPRCPSVVFQLNAGHSHTSKLTREPPAAPSAPCPPCTHAFPSVTNCLGLCPRPLEPPATAPNRSRPLI